MRDQLVVSISDLRFVSLLCRHCNTRIVLDLDTEFEAPRTAFLVPKSCCRCDNPFDSSIPASIGAIQRAYKALAPVGEAVTFVTLDPAEVKPVK